MSKKIIALFTVTALIITAGLLTLTVTAAEKRGNTAGNINNKGIAAISGDWVYYSNGGDFNSLYKIKKDGTGKKKLNDKSCSNINVAGDYIYFTGKDYGEPDRLFKIKTDGSGETALLTGSFNSVSVVGGWIYYRDSGNKNNIYKVKTDGTGKKKLNKDNSQNVCVSGDWIYYANNSDGGKIYRVTTDGKSKKKICDAANASNVIVDGDYVYFSTVQGIFKLKSDGSGKVQTLIGDSASNLNISDGYIYYTNEMYDKDGSLYRMKTNGTGVKRLTNERASDINIAGKWIFCMYANDYYRMNLDGSGKAVLK